MALISDKQQLVPAQGVGLTDVSGFGRSDAAAWDKTGSLLRQKGYEIQKDDAIKRAIVDAGEAPLEYDEEGNVAAPRTVDSEGNLFGPTIYEEKYSAVLLDRYRNEAKNEAVEMGIELANKHKNDPEAFKEVWNDYRKKRVKTGHPLVRGELDKLFDDVGTRHYAGIANRRAEADYTAAVKASGMEMQRKVNHLSQMVRQGYNVGSEEFSTAMTDVMKHHAVDVQMGYANENDTPAFVQSVNQYVASATLFNKLNQVDGKTRKGEMLRREILTGVTDGTVKVPLFGINSQGFIVPDGEIAIGELLGQEGLNRLKGEIDDMVTADAQIGKLERFMYGMQLEQGLMNWAMREAFAGNPVGYDETVSEFNRLTEKYGVPDDYADQERFNYVSTAIQRTQATGSFYAQKALGTEVSYMQNFLDAIEAAYPDVTAKLDESRAEFDEKMKHLPPGDLGNKARLEFLQNREAAIRKMITKKSGSKSELDMMNMMTDYFDAVKMRQDEYESKRPKPEDAASPEYKEWLAGRKKHVKKHVATPKFKTSAGSSRQVDSFVNMALANNGLLADKSGINWQVEQNPSAIKLAISEANNYGVLPKSLGDYLKSSAASFESLSEPAQIQALAIYQEVATHGKLKQVLSHESQLGQHTNQFFRELSARSGSYYVGAPEQLPLDQKLVQDKAAVLAGEKDASLKWGNLYAEERDYVKENLAGFLQLESVQNIDRQFYDAIKDAFAARVSIERGQLGSYSEGIAQSALAAAVSDVVAEDSAFRSHKPYVKTRFGLAGADIVKDPRAIAKRARESYSILAPYKKPIEQPRGLGDHLTNLGRGLANFQLMPFAHIIHGARQVGKVPMGNVEYITSRSKAPEYYYGEEFNPVLAEAVQPVLDRLKTTGQMEAPTLGLNVFLVPSGYSTFKGPTGQPLPSWELFTVSPSGALNSLNGGGTVLDAEINQPYLKWMKEESPDKMLEALEKADDDYQLRISGAR